MTINAIRPHTVRRVTTAALVAITFGTSACGSDDGAGGEEPVESDAPSDTIRPPAETAPPDTEPAATEPPTEPPTTESASGEPPNSAPDSSEPASTTPRGSAAVDVAIDDMAARRGIDGSEIAVVLTEDVTWRDGSIGCPQKDMAYTQALVPGMRIVLEAGNIRDVYHSGNGGEPFYCAMPDEPLDSTGGASGDV